jgi:hypothetical protein
MPFELLLTLIVLVLTIGVIYRLVERFQIVAEFKGDDPREVGRRAIFFIALGGFVLFAAGFYVGWG